MSIIPTALGGGQRLDNLMMATDVFDTAGTSSWSHPSPGNAIEVQVTIVSAGGGGGGGAVSTGGSGTDGTNGTDTIWDTSGSPITAIGGGSGSKGDDDNDNPGFGGASNLTVGAPGGSSNGGTRDNNIIGGTPYGYGGRAGADNSVSYGGGQGGTGEVKQFRQTVTNDIDIIIGARGTGGVGTTSYVPGTSDGGDGGNGAVYVSYAKAAVGIPAPVQKEFVEEWLDWDSTVSGSGTWTHPRPGSAITMTVIAIGGAGGNADTVSGDGTAGGNTTFEAITANGGEGGNTSSHAELNDNGIGGILGNYSGFHRLTGYGHFGATNGTTGTNNSSFYSGAPGSVKISRITVTGNVSYSIGDGGAEGSTDIGVGLPGGIILKYSY